VKTATAYSPCNITGFFQIHDKASDPLQVGSTGAGVALAKGVNTKLSVKKAQASRVDATFNGKRLPRKSVSARVATRCIELDGRQWRVDVTHTSPLPVGCGYGTSGAGALSLSLALNETMGLSLSTLEAAQIAHISEIECKTGLGTVASVFSGGLTLRTIPGAPGVGRVSKVAVPSSLMLITASFGPISTRSILGRASLKRRVNACGKGLIQRFDRRSPQKSFMILSKGFAECVGLMSQRLSRLVTRLDSTGIKSSMTMLGESVFCIAPMEVVPLVTTFLRKHGMTPYASRIAKSGAHML